jgi:hypothetical protein
MIVLGLIVLTIVLVVGVVFLDLLLKGSEEDRWQDEILSEKLELYKKLMTKE